MRSSLGPAGIALVLAAGMLFYVQGVLIPYQQKDAAATGRPRGNLSDLYPRWLGARELLLNGRDPYSPDITREIQTGYYGRPLEPGRPSEPTDQQGFAYPVFVAFLLAPTILLPFDLVQSGFYGFLLFLTAASVLLWLAFLQWRPSRGIILAMILLAAGSFPVVQGVKLQQLTLLVGGLIALAAASLSRGYLIPAGILMAIAMIKPQLAIPVSGWLFVWSTGDWKHRKGYSLAFGSTMALLLGASEWVLPGWMGRFREAVLAYRGYTGGAGSLLDTLISPTWGRLVALLIVAVVVVLCWKSRRVASSGSRFFRMTSLVLSATVVIVPMIAPYNQILLLPSILLLALEWPTLRKDSGLVRALTWGSTVMIAWPWFGALVLTVASLWAAPDRVQQWWAVPLYTSLFIPLWVLALELVSWSRSST